MKKNTLDIGPVLLEYRALKDKETKRAKSLMQLIVAKYAPMVKGMAEKMVKSKDTPPSLRNLDDLIQAGYLGLVYAVKKWEPPPDAKSLGSKFTSYARFKVIQHIQLVIAKANTVHRSRQESMPAPVTAKFEAFRSQHGREPRAEEIDVPKGKLDNWRNVPSCIGLEGGARIQSRHVPHPIRISIGATLQAESLSPEQAANRRSIIRSLESHEKEFLRLAMLGESYKSIAAAEKVDVEVVAEFFEWLEGELA